METPSEPSGLCDLWILGVFLVCEADLVSVKSHENRYNSNYEKGER